MEETGGNATSEKGRDANDESWSPVGAIEGKYKYMIREMRLQSEM